MTHTVLRSHSQDLSDLVLGVLAEDIPETLGAVFALRAKTNATIAGLLAMADEVDGRRARARARARPGVHSIRTRQRQSRSQAASQRQGQDLVSIHGSVSLARTGTTDG